MRTFSALLFILSLFAMAHSASMAWPAAPTCDLALVLAMDSSASIDMAEHRMIREGTAEALRHPAVVSAFASGRVALRVIEYADHPAELVPWTMIGGAVDLDIVASTLTEMKRTSGGNTGMGNAMFNARQSFDALPCAHNVLDILADGESNTGPPPESARKDFREGIDQINVLFVGDDAGYAARMEGVIFGTGSFVMPVSGFKQIGKGMMRKLLLEVSMGLTGRMPA